MFSKKEYIGKSLWDILDWENRVYLFLAIISSYGLGIITMLLITN